MNRKVCNQVQCNRAVLANGLCNMHYKRLYRGKPLGNSKPQYVAHGLTSRDKSKEHSLYKTWESMRARCNNSNRPEYKHYGARGIKVCKRWDNFALFVKDMGDRPEGMTLDRKDNNGDYTPKNCRWATRAQQRASQRIPEPKPIRLCLVKDCGKKHFGKGYCASHYYALIRKVQNEVV